MSLLPKDFSQPLPEEVQEMLANLELMRLAKRRKLLKVAQGGTQKTWLISLVAIPMAFLATNRSFPWQDSWRVLLLVGAFMLIHQLHIQLLQRRVSALVELLEEEISSPDRPPTR